MRKLATLLVLILLRFVSGQTQTCTVNGADYVGNFISCANDPTTTIIEFGPPPNRSGYGTIAVVGTDPAVDLSGITINVPDKMTLQLSGNIIIDAGTNFQGSGGNVEVKFGEDGTVYKANGNENSQNDNFEKLNSLIVDCSADPDPFECLELAPFLPVELTHFQAQPKNNEVILSWTTASELNNDFFGVEHSRDGRTFSAVGKVRGAGTSAEVRVYQFTHRTPQAGTHYYRLKQVDYDGTFDYSEMVAVKIDRRSTAVQIYPNPTVRTAVILMEERPERINFQLFNLLGRRIDRQPTIAEAGWELDLSRLPGGIYLLRMEYDGKVLTKRIMKE